MTPGYNQFYSAVDAGLFKPTTTLSVKLCDKTYIPDVSHGLKDITGVILTATGVLTFSELISNGMSWIVDTLKDRAVAYKEAHPDRVEEGSSIDDVAAYVVYSGGLRVLCFCEEVTNGSN